MRLGKKLLPLLAMYRNRSRHDLQLMAAQQVYLGRESISHLILIVNKSRTNSSGGTCQLDNLILNNVPMPSMYQNLCLDIQSKIKKRQKNYLLLTFANQFLLDFKFFVYNSFIDISFSQFLTNRQTTNIWCDHDLQSIMVRYTK